MIVDFDKLQESNLTLNTVYKGGNKGNVSDEVLSKLMRCENSSGFRKKGSLKNHKLEYVVLYSTGKHSEWKDTLNVETGEFIYYGDQDKINKDIHDTPKKGNEVLRRTFEDLKKGNRKNVAPFFVFIKEEGRDVKFLGLAVPGSPNKSIDECLEVVITNKSGGQIKNYKAIFTILDIEEINRKWLEDLENGKGLTSEYVPLKWKFWIEEGEYFALIVKVIEEQTEQQDLNKVIIEKEFIENTDIIEFDNLIANIYKLQFEIMYKPIDTKKQENSSFIARNKEKFSKPKKNYIQEYIKKQIAGIIGEAIILKKERERLVNSKNVELIEKAEDIEWSSQDIGDGLGYDIKSFDIKNGKVVNKYIEVKTTVGPDDNFEITALEVEKSHELNEIGIYTIARIYNLDIKNKKADFYLKEGNLQSNYELKTSVYIASRK